jgi:hypothetical protein
MVYFAWVGSVFAPASVSEVLARMRAKRSETRGRVKVSEGGDAQDD